MDKSIGEKEFLSEKEWLGEFIKVYKENPPLWDDSLPEFPHKSSRKRGYAALLKVLKKKDKNGTIDDVRKKINSLKTSYRRELRKLKESQNSEFIYEPSVWWFDLMNFATKKRNAENSKANDASSSCQASNEISEEEIMPPELKKPKTTSQEEIISPPTKYEQRNEDEYDYLGKISEEENIPIESKTTKRNEINTSSNKSLLKEEDEYDLLGKLWAKKLRKMTQSQRVLAEKYIHDIIFQGEVGLIAYAELEN